MILSSERGLLHSYRKDEQMKRIDLVHRRVINSVVMVLCVLALSSCTPADVANDNSAKTLSSASGETQLLTGKVIRVIDGDTIEVLDNSKQTHRVRLAAIDAPEKRQPFAVQSRQSLAKMTAGTEVRVEWSRLDESQHLVGKVTQNQRDICLEQIRTGFAWHLKQRQFEQSTEDRAEYAAAETRARAAKAGLWRDTGPTEPWVFREYRRQRPATTTPTPETDTAPDPEPVLTGVRGNRRSMIYHWPGCPNYDDIAPHNRVYFESREAAESAGYRAARNCR